MSFRSLIASSQGVGGLDAGVDAGAGAGLAGAGAGGVGLAGLLTGFTVEGTTRLGFCLSGSTSGPFWPHANSVVVKPMTINKRARFMMLSIPAASLSVRPELMSSRSGPSKQRI
jgi:hypothetical protein